MTLRLHNAIVYAPVGPVQAGAFDISGDGRILYAGEETIPGVQAGIKAPALDMGGRMILPGFIDVHTHGGYGVTFGMGDLAEGLKRYSRWAVSTGVVGFLSSLVAPDFHTLIDRIGAYAALCEAKLPGAALLGLHIEGPFLNPEKKGAFDPGWLRAPDPREAQAILDAGRGWVRQVTLAPELAEAGEAAALFRRAGVVVALGHSNADYEQAARALEGDFTHVTHTYNAQSGFDHRRPGVVGAVLSSRQATAELIADGRHVHPAAMQVLYRCLGQDRLVLVTDAMAGAGFPDGDYTLMDRPIRVRGGVASLPDGTLAGSTATLNACVQNAARLAGIPFGEAVRMASENPARVARVSHRLGRLEAGMEASLTVMDAEGEIYLTMVSGEIVFRRE